MSLNGGRVEDHRRMIVRLDTHRLQTLDQVREFLDGSEQVDLQPQTRADAYAFVAKTVRRFDYALRGRADKGLLRRFLAKAAGLSRAQITRLLQQHRPHPLPPPTQRPPPDCIQLAHQALRVPGAVNRRRPRPRDRPGRRASPGIPPPRTAAATARPIHLGRRRRRTKPTAVVNLDREQAGRGPGPPLFPFNSAGNVPSRRSPGPGPRVSFT